MFKALRWLLAGVVLLPGIVVAAAVALFFYTFEDAPVVGRMAPADYATVVAGKELVKRIKRQVESAGAGGTTLIVTETELRHLAQMGSHTFKQVNSDVHFDSTTIDSRMSIHLPPNPFGGYLNLGVKVGQSGEGFGIERLSIGPLDFSGRWLLPLAAKLVDVLVHDDQASLFLASVRGFRIEGETALLKVFPPPDVKAQFKLAVRTLQAYRFPPGEEERVIYYYRLLAGITAQQARHGGSLTAYLTPLMAAAADRTAHSTAIEENRAAVWAMAIYFSNGAFETLIGKLVSGKGKLVHSPSDVTLAGRDDLMLHFIYSAGITLATQQGIGIAAGEFKELLDSGDGGSGFSFADLAADRAGIQFVTAATDSEVAARQMQQRLVALNSEAAFFPNIAGLVEGLSEEQFRRQFGSAESARYRQQVAAIDRRIASLPVY